MGKRFASSLYRVKTEGGEELQVDVTNSISSGLSANNGLMSHVIKWMKDMGCQRVLDFGAGALRHTIPLLEADFEVTAVEYERAYTRPKAAEYKAVAEKYDTFTELLWPHDFLKSKVKYDVAILSYVLQVIPVKSERHVILKAIAERFAKSSPKRLYYASRVGDAKTLENEMKHGDGWVKGVGDNDRSFYTEWNSADTDAFFEKAGFQRAGNYSGPQQPFIYEMPGVL